MISKEFGQNITYWRKTKGYTQADLAKHSGLHRSFISGIEAGGRNVTLETISKIASALSVPIADLFSSATSELETTTTPKEVLFLKLGGTWDMVDSKDGLIGKGKLDDQKLQKLEGKTKNNELALLTVLQREMFQTQPVGKDIASHLFWVENIDKLITGQFMPVFSGDSSNYRNSLLAVVMEYIFTKIKENPSRQILAGICTDTTDIILPFLDAFTFDKQLPPILVTGANRSHKEKNSDAPKNFYDLATATHLPLLPGAYYIFHHVIYKGGDIVKIDPSEEPTAIEGLTTFFAPHRTQSKISLLQKGANTTRAKSAIGNLVRFTADNIFWAMNSVVTIDLGDMNTINEEVNRINSKKYKAVIIKSHALGNTPSPIKNAAAKAARSGKLVLNVSRCLIASTSNRYALSLSRASSQIITGNRLNPQIAKALLVRALLENRTQSQTRELVDKYSKRTF